MAALAAPKASLRPFLLASLLVHLGLIFLGQRLIRPGGGGEAGFGEAPPGFERALPGTAGLPAGMRLGWVELSPAIRMVALGTPTPKAGPPAPAAVAPEPVVVPAESPAAEDQSPALESALGTSTTGEATGPAGDPAGSPAGEATGGGGGDGGGGGGSGGAGGGSGGPATDFVRGRDTLPVVQSMTVPDYPPEAKGRSRVPVVLLVHVTADGTVDDVRRGEATDCPPCEAAAIKSAWQLRFTPGTRDGVPAAMWVRYPVTFGRK